MSLSSWLLHNCWVIVMSSAIDCDVISRRKTNRDTGTMCKDHRFIVIYGFVMSCKNKVRYALSWRTVSALTWVLFCCLLPLLLHNSGNRHQNNPLGSAETVCHSSTYIIHYLSYNGPCWITYYCVIVMLSKNIQELCLIWTDIGSRGVTPPWFCPMFEFFLTFITNDDSSAQVSLAREVSLVSIRQHPS